MVKSELSITHCRYTLTLCFLDAIGIKIGVSNDLWASDTLMRQLLFQLLRARLFLGGFVLGSAGITLRGSSLWVWVGLLFLSGLRVWSWCKLGTSTDLSSVAVEEEWNWCKKTGHASDERSSTSNAKRVELYTNISLHFTSSRLASRTICSVKSGATAPSAERQTVFPAMALAANIK